MKRVLFIIGLVVLSTAIPFLSNGQKDKFAYVVTDITPQGHNWSTLRAIDLKTGFYSNILLDGNAIQTASFDAATKKEVTAIQMAATSKRYNPQPAFSTGVAGIALDAKNNRLWFTPMFIDQLRYLDLKSMKVYHVGNATLNNQAAKAADQSNIFTRMVIAADGNGYVLSNDANSFVQFTTGKKTSITQLGSLVDNAANKEVSIHSSSASYGGDMIADNDGNLWVFSAKNHVFKVNITTKVATYLGKIAGLPNNFTTNGVAVTDDNHILIVSATQSDSYLVDSKNLLARGWEKSTGYMSSDLGNSNLLNVLSVAEEKATPKDANKTLQTFPNPVITNEFVIQFNKIEAGDYNVQLTDIMGKKILQQKLTLGSNGKTKPFILSSGTAKGVYLLTVLNNNNKSIHTEKLVVQ